MRMTAKNVVGVAKFGVANSSIRNFLGKSQPTLAFPFEKTAYSFIPEVYNLYAVVDFCCQKADQGIIDKKIIKLVPMNSNIFLVSELPFVYFIRFCACEDRKQID